MLVGLNWCSESGYQPENKLPNEGDEVYFQLINNPYRYIKYETGRFINNQFHSEWRNEEPYSIKEVDYWVLTSDPTAIQRLIFYLDLDFYFDAADWERSIDEDGIIEDSYPNPPSSVDIEDLGLTEQTETSLREYIEFAESQGSFNCTDPKTVESINQRGLLVYEELRKELADKCYLVYYPISNLSTEYITAFPFLIDNNEAQVDWKFVNTELPAIGIPVRFQLDSYTGEFGKGIFNGVDFISTDKVTFSNTKIVRWQYL